MARETLRSPVASLTPLAHSQPHTAWRICIEADRRQGRECARCNVWPLHHQSGSVPAPPTPHDEGDPALPSTHRPTLRGLDARHRFADGSRAGACLPPAPCLACRWLRIGDSFPLAVCVSIGYTRAMSGKDSGFRIRVERELREEFISACRKQDRPAAQVLREFMRAYVANTDQPNSGQERPTTDYERR